MSFDIFLLCVRNGEAATFGRSTLYEVFGASIVSREPDGFFKLYFADGGGADVYSGDDDDVVQHIGFNRPGGDMFFDALYRLAEVTKSVVFWPSKPPAVAVTDEATLAHLPDGFSGDGIGPAWVVHSGRELRDYIFRKRR
jgi:hypothetical protein